MTPEQPGFEAGPRRGSRGSDEGSLPAAPQLRLEDLSAQSIDQYEEVVGRMPPVEARPRGSSENAQQS